MAGLIERQTNSSGGLVQVLGRALPRPPVFRKPPTEREDFSESDAAAYQWLNACASRSETPDIFAYARQSLPSLPDEKRDAILRHWWNSEDERLRLSAALVASFQSVSYPSLAHARDLLRAILFDASDSHRQLLAALGLAGQYVTSFNRAPVPSETSQTRHLLSGMVPRILRNSRRTADSLTSEAAMPEPAVVAQACDPSSPLDALVSALAKGASRSAARAGLAALVICLPGPWPCDPTSTVLQNVTRILDDEDLAPGDILLLLSVHLRLRLITVSSYRSRIEPALQSAETPIALILSLCEDLTRVDGDLLGDLLLSAGIPGERRLRIVNHLLACEATRLPIPSDPGTVAVHGIVRVAQRLLDAYAEEPQLACRALAWFGTHGSIPTEDRLRHLAQQSDLPLPLRQELFRALWSWADTIETAYPTGEPVLACLMKLAEDAEVVRHVLAQQAIPAYRGAVSAEWQTRILRRLRQAAKDSAANYSSLFALCISADTQASEDDRRLVIEQQVLLLSLANDANRTIIENVLAPHAHVIPSVARALIEDPRLSSDLRATLLQTDLPYQYLVAFASRNRESSLLQEEHVAGAIGRLVPFFLRDELQNAARTNARSWQELLTIPAFVSEDPSTLVPVAKSRDYTSLVQLVALEWIVASCRHSPPEQATRVVKALLSELQASGLDSEENWMLVRGMRRICDNASNSDGLLKALARLVVSTEFSDELRRQLFSSLPTCLVTRYPRQFWETLMESPDRVIRSSGLELFITHRKIAMAKKLLAMAAQLRSAQTSEEIEAAEVLWRSLARLPDVVTTDAPQLIRIASDTSATPILREIATEQLTYLKLDLSTLRSLWAFVATQEGATIWTSATMVKGVQHQLMKSVKSKSLNQIFVQGPEHALWLGLTKLAQIPDQSLAQKALSVFSAPKSDDLRGWRSNVVPDVPDEALLAVSNLMRSTGVQSNAVRLINRAFAAIRGQHTLQADLTDILIRTATKPKAIRARIASLLNECQDNLTGAERAREIIRLIRFAQLEAQLVAQLSRKGSSFSDDSEADLENQDYAKLYPVVKNTPISQIADALRDVSIQRLLPLLPGTTASQLADVLQETIAPAILAEHYQRTHRSGLPLLAQAVQATSGGPGVWNEWRFARPEARAQLSYLDDAQLALWRQDLRMPVGSETVSPDVRGAALRIRERFQQALHNGEIPEEYRVLFTDVVSGQRSPALQIGAYRELRAILGKRLGGKRISLPDDLKSKLPENIVSTVESLLPGSRDPQHEVQQELLALGIRLDRAIDLLRLLYCDERALSRNALFAEGELRKDGTPNSVGAVAYFAKMRHAFRYPLTRKQRFESGSESLQLDAALEDAQAALRGIHSFAPSASLIAMECSDFKTLIEIGNRPYGQGSCQNYMGSHDYNRALLAYVVDAMTKALVICAPTSGDDSRVSPLARAIVRLGELQETKEPVLILEKTYATAGTQDYYTPLLRQAARTFAALRGWRVAIPGSQEGTARIPKSQNGLQYEDGAIGLAKDEYRMDVIFIGDE